METVRKNMRYMVFMVCVLAPVAGRVQTQDGSVQDTPFTALSTGAAPGATPGAVTGGELVSASKSSTAVAEKSGPSSLPIPLAMTTSGGVSLGAYQAGYLYYLVEIAKLNPHLFDPKVITGASAGTINAFVSTIALGNTLQPAPQKSLFYRLWTELDIKQILDVESAPPLALSSRKALIDLAQKMERRWNEGLSEDLDVVIGVTATTVESRDVEVSTGFKVPRQEEKFVFRVRGRGKGRLPLVTNYIDTAHGISQPLLPFGDPGNLNKTRTNFSVLTDVMFASSAFPLAFPPQEVSFCLSVPDMGKKFSPELFYTCKNPSQHSRFLDGAVLDRNPLGLAHRIAVSGLVYENGAYRFVDLPDSNTGKLPPTMAFLYLEALNASYPAVQKKSDMESIEALFPTFGSYSRGLVKSSQQRRLYMLADNYPEMRQRISMTYRNYPSASGLLGNFFGFFDRKLRDFDFYLGMYDAHQYMSRYVTRSMRNISHADVAIVFPENTESAQNEPGWEQYRYMNYVYGRDAHYKGSCQANKYRDFRILVQVSLNRLYDHCSRLPVDETLAHFHCLDAMKGNLPPEIQPMEDGTLEDNWKKRDGETEFNYSMRLLEKYHFWFEELNLEREDAWEAMSRIREFLAGALDDYAKKLPPAESLTLRIFGKPALNFFKYQPPQMILYLIAGQGSEFGMSAAGRYSPYRWLRFNTAVQFKGFYELIGPQPNMLALTPYVGIEIENVGWASPIFQGRLGLRAGYQFSTGDAFSKSLCDQQKMLLDERRCSAPVGQAFLAVTLFERVRVQGGVEWFPYFLPPMDRLKKNIWNGFIQFGWQWISPF